MKSTIKIAEIFSSIQGEGGLVGTPAIFIRTSGCNLKCSFCDTDHTSHAKQMTIDTIMKRVKSLTKDTQIRHIVITGGEPLDNITTPDLCLALFEEGFHIQFETNGTTFPTWLRLLLEQYQHLITITCSPKGFMNSVFISHATEFKLLCDHTGGIWAPAAVKLSFKRLLADRKIFIQPIHTSNVKTDALSLRHAVDFVKRHPNARISVQLHKLLNWR